MSSKELKSLPADTVRLIGGAQVITSVFSVVKELVENAFDSESTNVDVKLENYGLDRIEVRDNGFGIRKSAIQVVAKRHHTSKISSFNDLEDLCTYGFRGEALGSLCSVSNMTITTKTSEDNVSQTYTFDYNGNVQSEKPSHLGQGTTVSASNLFKNVPVRRQFYDTVKKKKEEIKKVEELLMVYGVLRPDVRIVLKNNKDILWQKTVMTDARAVLNSVFGRNTVSKMVEKSVKSEDSKVSVQAFLPKKGSEVSSTSRSTNDRCWLAVNKRPVHLKDLEKVVKQHYCHGNNCENRFPMCFIHTTVPSSDIDVNVDPNKTKVMLHHHSVVIQQLCVILEDLYGPIVKPASPERIHHSRINDSTLSDSCSDSSFVDSFDNHCGNKKDVYSSDGSKGSSMGSRPTKVAPVERMSTESLVPGNKVVMSGFYKNSDDKSTKPNGSKVYDEAIREWTGTSERDANVIEYDHRSGEVEKAKQVCEESVEAVVSIHRMEGNVNEKELDNISQLENGRFDIMDDELENLFDTQDNSRIYADTTEESANTTDEIFANIAENTNVMVSINSDPTSTDRSDASKETEDYLEDGLNTTDDILALIEDREGDEVLGITGRPDTIGKEPSISNATGAEKSVDSDMLDWSKGISEHQTDGEIIQPVKLLTSGSNTSFYGNLSKKRPCTPIEDTIGTPQTKRRSTDNQVNQPKLYDMVGRSPADKLSVGFLAFSKEFRPEVVGENPKASHDEITHKVRRKWGELPDDVKEKYDEAGRKHVAALKKKAAEKKQDTSLLQADNRLQKVQGLPSIKDQMIASRKKMEDSNIKPIKSVKVSFSMKSLKRSFRTGLRQTQTQSSSSLQLIGPLKFYNGWVCRHGNKIQMINPHRVEETLLHQELIENHIIPAAKLENTIGLNESSVGGVKLYEKLVEMVPTNTHQTFMYMNDRRLKANGIEIRCHLDQNSQPILELVGLANCMPTYGVKDLCEILDLITNSGAKTVAQSRPLKVKFYLQGEAVRMVRQRPVHRSREDLIELFEQMEDTLPVDCVTCLHNRPFMQTLYDLNDVPVSQSV